MTFSIGRLLKVGAGVAVASVVMAQSAQAGLVLPAPQNGVTTLRYGDFDVFSLPFLNFLATGNTNQLGDFEVQSTPGIIKDFVVVATGADGKPVNTNFPGMDDALSTPNNEVGVSTFVSLGNEPGTPNDFVGDVSGTWDARIDALQAFLAGDDLLIFFNLNETNNTDPGLLSASQDALVFGIVTLVDLDGGAPDIVLTLDGLIRDSLNAVPPIANPVPGVTFPGPFDFDGGGPLPPVADSGHIHGEICVRPSDRTLIRLGPCTQADGADSATINQNLGADRAAFAVTSAGLSELIRTTAVYDVLRFDFRLGEIDNGFEQLFITTLERVDIPEPGTLGLLGVGLIGLGFARRRRQ